ncbi:hypothetical protein ElyMa_003293100 [Elysia marginata]|uniref:Uncharacterized protein n=1 Tax=Elysia marginata TaxID=1093978 RepID=A0AAV4J9V0_9GAST|nr:hypothetical protein ElyMa_003293100 [Elysia marginata]
MQPITPLLRNSEVVTYVNVTRMLTLGSLPSTMHQITVSPRLLMVAYQVDSLGDRQNCVVDYLLYLQDMPTMPVEAHAAMCIRVASVSRLSCSPNSLVTERREVNKLNIRAQLIYFV